MDAQFFGTNFLALWQIQASGETVLGPMEDVFHQRDEPRERRVAPLAPVVALVALAAMAWLAP